LTVVHAANALSQAKTSEQLLPSDKVDFDYLANLGRSNRFEIWKEVAAAASQPKNRDDEELALA
jgi:hypothetical protein